MKKNLYFLLCILWSLMLSAKVLAQPTFTMGRTQTLSLCQNSVASVNTNLSVGDLVPGKTETWNIVTGPVHGTATAAYSTTSSGTVMVPTGTSYSPTFGYSGTDSFTVRVTDGTASDTTTIYITVNANPAAISGPANLCAGNYVTMSDATTGGTWSSSSPFIASINMTSGAVTTGVPGTTIITYMITATGCKTSSPLTVISAPAGISGASSVCSGRIIAMSDASSGGTWSSSDLSVITITTGGLATGVAGGTATISYTLSSGCSATKSVTVMQTATITGIAPTCPSLGIILSASVPGGTWTSTNTMVATISGSGAVAGISAGTTTISYMLPYGCFSVFTETVNPSPAPISGSPFVCVGLTTSISDATPGGSWTSDNSSIAYIGSTSGLVMGMSPGTANITYEITATGCISTMVASVNPLPNVYSVTGGGSYCTKDTGVHIYINPTDAYTNYFLHVGSIAVGPYPSLGGMLDFGLHTLAGTYVVTATNTLTGCTNSMSGSATITPIPSPVASVSISSDKGSSVCGGTFTIFSATPTNGGLTQSYLWKVNGIDVAIDTVNYGYAPSNNDTIIVRMAGTEVCATPDTVRDTFVMTVIDRQIPIVDLSPSPNDTICLGQSVTLFPVPTWGGPSPIYIYRLGSTLIGTGSHLAYKPNDGDIIDVYMVSNYVCRIADTVVGTIKITVDTPIPPFVIIDAYPPVLKGPGQSETFVARIPNAEGTLLYQWYINDSMQVGATTDTFVTDVLTYDANDSVTCMVTHLGACYMTTYGWRKMENNIGVRPVSTFSPEIAVIPNPNKGSFVVRGSLGGSTDEPFSLELSNMIGQLIYRHNAVAKDGQVNEQVITGDTLPGGMYLLNVRSASGGKAFHIVIEK